MAVSNLFLPTFENFNQWPFFFQATEETLRTKFSEKGLVTDVQLKYKNGVFRKFAFVGFKKEEDAKAALEHFNNTCIGTARICVEVCSDIGMNIN